ncbi:uncharacterized protein MELLADRAFT_103484 [Melampsora larici-populina 98AG31]|uniref:Uncharacterized protein n=1 Tax=Melampsora larici-populina (strain 98AG31 / pathotype 3-4-7) TaxID=747676 RepID=F4RB19_MELLP|nr:uncharacterized protein MELLADRAFT_103484 [Melampsora larici-populina 98AG31]EGG10101.1 hypothetical protein MELLADRAFT_103484 [Melampsora larici-populina 98AG31]
MLNKGVGKTLRMKDIGAFQARGISSSDTIPARNSPPAAGSVNLGCSRVSDEIVHELSKKTNDINTDSGKRILVKTHCQCRSEKFASTNTKVHQSEVGSSFKGGLESKRLQLLEVEGDGVT